MNREEKQAFLANFRHDLRTPINAVIGYSEMLLEDAAEDRGELEAIHTAGKDLLARINRLLDPAEVGTVEVGTLGDALRRELCPLISSVTGATEFLLQNAGGEDAADLARIHAASLHLRALVDRAGNLEKGSATLSTSNVSSKREEAVTTIARLEPRGAAGPGGTILIVDDSEMNRDLLARHLERHGHATRAAENGREALVMMKRHAFDLVLLDVMMPEMNGFEMLQRLKGEVRLREIPVIMISALDEIDSVVRCIEMGAEDYLAKPFNPVLLQARIGACLEKKRLRDQELDYLDNVARVTAAANAVESGGFDAGTLVEVAERPDALGNLARVFTRMAKEIHAREERLKAQVQQLKIEVDEAKTAKEVARITESDYFQSLQKRAKELRARQRNG